jgi:hypothetical protein
MPESYEELRNIVVEFILKPPKPGEQARQWNDLVRGVTSTLAQRSGTPHDPSIGRGVTLPNDDAELVREIFWDLFRQGYITLGADQHNATWPWFKVSRFGQTALASHEPYRFHDTNSFTNLVKHTVPDISPEAEIYAEEAVAAFYAGCLLASCVMIGGAAEAEFLRLLDVASKGPYTSTFASVSKQQFIGSKITKFQKALTSILGHLSKGAVEDIDTHFTMIQSILRIARNDAGHPTGSKPSREQVYVFLQLFVPFARQLMKLRLVLA